MDLHIQSLHQLPAPCRPQFPFFKRKTCRHSSFRCSLSTLANSSSAISHVVNDKPFPAEVSRTLMELSSVGTLSTLSHEGWPIGVGVRFSVDEEGTPILCLGASQRQVSVDTRCSLHIQLDQCGMRTPQCTILGSLSKTEDSKIMKCRNFWAARFAEEADAEVLHVVSVERVLQTNNFMEDGVWVSSSEFKSANPDPLRNFARLIVNEVNANNAEDLIRFCNVYVDLDFLVREAKLIWVDRLGFDLRVFSNEGVFDVRIPFPREVIDEKGAKSSFNCMSQLAWEVEKNLQAPNFHKVKEVKQISYGAAI